MNGTEKKSCVENENLFNILFALLNKVYSQEKILSLNGTAWSHGSWFDFWMCINNILGSIIL